MKRLGCCLISILLTVAVIIAAVYGLGAFAYNKYVKDITTISYNQAWGVLFSLYGSNDDKMITNPYNKDEEIAAIDTEINKLLFIAEDSKFSISALIDEMLKISDKDDNDNETQETEGDTTHSDALANAENNPNPNEGNAFMSVLDSLKFDFSTLKNYNGEKHLFTMTDKQLAAVIDNAVIGVLGEYLNTLLGDMNVATEDIIGVKQASITVGENEEVNEDTTITATVKLELRNLAGKLLDKVLPSVSFAKGILPNAVYLTLNIKPAGDGKISFKLNDNNDKQSETLEQLINGILNYSSGTKGEDRLNSALNKIDSVVKSTFKQLGDKLNLRFANSSMEADPIVMLIKTLGIANVTSEDLLYMISYIMQPIEEIAKHLWDNEKANEFFDDFKTKMPIADEFELNMENFVDQLTKISDNIDLDAIDFSLTNEDMQVVMNYDALTGLVNELAFGKNSSEEQADEGGEKTDLVKGMKINKIECVDAETQTLRFIIELDIVELSGVKAMKDGLVKNVLSALLKDKMYIDATVTIGGEAQGNVLINELSAEKTEDMLKVFDAVAAKLMPSMAGSFSEEKLIKMIDDAVQKGLSSIRGEGETAALDIKFGADGVEMGSIYEMLIQREKIDLSADEVRLALGGVDDNTEIKSAIIGGIDDQGFSYDLAAENPTLTLNDSYMANIVKEEVKRVHVDGKPVVFEQLLVADLINSEDYAIRNNAALMKLLNNNGFSDKRVMIASVSFTLNSNVFKKQLYATVMYDLDDKDNHAMVINSMDKTSTLHLQTLISKLGKKEINFAQIAQDIVDKVLKTTIKVKITDDIAYEKTVEEIAAMGTLSPIIAPNVGCGSVTVGLDDLLLPYSVIKAL